MAEHAGLHFTKHQAVGNDFLVLVDLEARRAITAAEARALCNRHLGVGADGVIRVRAGRETDLEMELRNADGSEAEMSGNGIRTLVQAATEAGAVASARVSVATLAGIRKVDYEQRGPGDGYATVGMGRGALGSDLSFIDPPGVISALSVNVGNPHIVLLMEKVDDEVVEEAGGLLSGSVDGGANIEFVLHEPGSDRIALRVYERGVGETLACGTGAVAAVVASNSWGLVGDEVDVDVLGGVLHVSIGDEEIFLSGPTRKVADVYVSESDLAGMVSALSHNPYAAVIGSTDEMVGRP